MKKIYLIPKNSVYLLRTSSNLMVGSNDENTQQVGTQEEVNEDDFTQTARQNNGSIWSNEW